MIVPGGEREGEVTRMSALEVAPPTASATAGGPASQNSRPFKMSSLPFRSHLLLLNMWWTSEHWHSGGIHRRHIGSYDCIREGSSFFWGGGGWLELGCCQLRQCREHTNTGVVRGSNHNLTFVKEYHRCRHCPIELAQDKSESVFSGTWNLEAVLTCIFWAKT